MTLFADIKSALARKYAAISEKFFGISQLVAIGDDEAPVPIRATNDGSMKTTLSEGSATVGKVDQGTPGTAGWLVRIVNAAEAIIGVASAPLAVRLSDGAQFVDRLRVRASAKGATPEADVTSTAVDADHQAIDVAEQRAPGYEDQVNDLAVTLEKPYGGTLYGWIDHITPQLAGGVSAAAHLVLGSACNLKAVTFGANNDTAASYVRIFDKATVAVAGSGDNVHCKYVITLEAGQPATPIVLPGKGRRFVNGLTYFISTTPETNTAPVAFGKTGIGLSYMA